MIFLRKSLAPGRARAARAPAADSSSLLYTAHLPYTHGRARPGRAGARPGGGQLTSRVHMLCPPLSSPSPPPTLSVPTCTILMPHAPANAITNTDAWNYGRTELWTHGIMDAMQLRGREGSSVLLCLSHPRLHLRSATAPRMHRRGTRTAACGRKRPVRQHGYPPAAALL